MRLLYRASVPKFADEPNRNEDVSAVAPSKGVYVVSDGATESYNSRAWANILVSHFAREPHFSSVWLKSAATEYNSRFDRESMSWSAQAAFDRGSFATLLGLVLQHENARLIAFGDTLAVLVDGSTVKDTFPYRHPEEFRARPLLLSTLVSRNSILKPHGFRNRFQRNWSIRGMQKPKILLMTDALGAWFLSAPNKRLGKLLMLTSRRAFTALIDAERSSGALRRDDTTLLIIG